MSTVTTLRAAFPSRVWKDAFVAFLTKQLPDLNPDAADEASDRAYLASRLMKPELAAREWVAKFLSSSGFESSRSA